MVPSSPICGSGMSIPCPRMHSAKFRAASRSCRSFEPRSAELIHQPVFQPRYRGHSRRRPRIDPQRVAEHTERPRRVELVGPRGEDVERQLGRHLADSTRQASLPDPRLSLDQSETSPAGHDRVQPPLERAALDRSPDQRHQASSRHESQPISRGFARSADVAGIGELAAGDIQGVEGDLLTMLIKSHYDRHYGASSRSTKRSPRDHPRLS
jgi:hypothetical protein